MLNHKLSVFLLVMLTFGVANLSASPESISAELYSKYGEIRTSKGILDRQKQYSIVSNWMAQYASQNRALSNFERLIVVNTKVNDSELNRFGCVSKVFGGYECDAVEDGKSIKLDLNKDRQITSALMCFGLPDDLRNMMYSLSPKMTDFMIDLMILGYGEQSRVFKYHRQRSQICASYD